MNGDTRGPLQTRRSSPVAVPAGFRRQSKSLVAAALVLVALMVVPVALADFGRLYKNHVYEPPFTALSDNVYHNHTYNDIYFGAGSSAPAVLYEVTPAGAIHFQKNGFGNISNSHPGTYYDAPFCGNNDSSGHYVDCFAAWG